MGNSNGLIILGAAAVGVGLLMFGCQAGITFFCRFRNPASALPSSQIPYPPMMPMSVDPASGLALPPGLPMAGGGGERQTLTGMMEFLTNQLVTDLDKYTFAELGRDTLFNLQAQVLQHEKDTLEIIADYNDMRIQPLQGRALAKYSELLLNTARRYGIALNPAAESMFRANLFSGSPTMGNTTANLALAMA